MSIMHARHGAGFHEQAHRGVPKLQLGNPFGRAGRPVHAHHDAGSVCGPQVRNKRKRTSQFRGVSKAGAKWKATITANGSKQELGRFDTELEAAQCARPPQTLHWKLSRRGLQSLLC